MRYETVFASLAERIKGKMTRESVNNSITKRKLRIERIK